MDKSVRGKSLLSRDLNRLDNESLGREMFPRGPLYEVLIYPFS